MDFGGASLTHCAPFDLSASRPSMYTDLLPSVYLNTFPKSSIASHVLYFEPFGAIVPNRVEASLLSCSLFYTVSISILVQISLSSSSSCSHGSSVHLSSRLPAPMRPRVLRVLRATGRYIQHKYTAHAGFLAEAMVEVSPSLYLLLSLVISDVSILTFQRR